MKNFSKLLINLLLVLCLCACASNAQKIQKQLELGNKFLVDLDYEQAILAFNKVIEIDPKNTEAYFGLGDAYYGKAKNAGDYSAADTLYTSATDNYGMVMNLTADGTGTTVNDKSLDEINQNVKDILAELYVAWSDLALKEGDSDHAAKILEDGYTVIGNDDLLEKSQTISSIKDVARPVSMAYFPKGEDTPLYTVVFEYDAAGKLVSGHYHNERRNRNGTYTYSYEENILKTSSFVWNDGEFAGTAPHITTYECDSFGRVISSLEDNEDEDSKQHTEVQFEYDEDGRLIGGSVSGYCMSKGFDGEEDDYASSDGKYVYYYE
ncbi:tetratricopeptide repeat protein [Oribacterium sp. FC2011]|uniref:tetratricopeptide repeat protein n=1 Tax=Oribacterium sp. FC2011 TaxID=1408311 RepID=UPI0004E14B9F|nr:tetratricopeptide repeat protein [Oribacterium sp. FC2011]